MNETPYDSAPATDAAAAKDTAVAAKNHAAGVADTGKQAAADVADTGKQAATEVAGTAADAAKDVAAETKKQASDLLGSTRQQLVEQAEVQQSSIVSTLRDLGDQLAAMTDGVQQDGTAVELATQARDRARSAAEWLDGRSPADVVDELRQVGRQRPGAFLLGALAAGVVAGRLTRGVVDVHTSDSTDSSEDGAGSTTSGTLTSATGSNGTPALPASYSAPSPQPGVNPPAPRHEAPLPAHNNLSGRA